MLMPSVRGWLLWVSHASMIVITSVCPLAHDVLAVNSGIIDVIEFHIKTSFVVGEV